MIRFKVTIYSPADKEEQENICTGIENLDKVVMALTGSMEIGSWFKIERIASVEEDDELEGIHPC